MSEVLQSRLLPAESYISGFLEEGYNVVLRALLDEVERDKPTQACADGRQVFLENWALLAQVEEEMRNMTQDFQSRLAEFRKNWHSRFSFKVMYPGLKAGRLILKHNGKYRLAGDDSHMFYQQSVQDMIVEGIRILALFSGTMSRFHEKTAVSWRRQISADNSCRIYMLVEETVRKKEIELLKNLRGRVLETFKNLFIRNVRDWSGRWYPDEENLFRHMAWPWYRPGSVDSGFEGFMLLFSEFISELTFLFLDISEKKWRLFLRGAGQKANISFT